MAYGYKFWLTVDSRVTHTAGLARKKIPAGRYAVMSAESSDYTVEWKGQAWARLLRILAATDYTIKEYDEGPRMFEEHVQHFPLDDIIRLDLYIELD